MNAINKPSKEDQTRKKVLMILAEFLGIEEQEILDEDSFADDLHMTQSDFAEFLAQLDNIGIDSQTLEIDDSKTVSDLLEEIHLNQPL